jgi:hypothetical protein
MPNLRVLLQAQLQRYGHPRTTWYGLMSGLLLTGAAVVAAVLRSHHWDLHLTPQLTTSDLIWYVAVLLAAALWFRLSWMLAHEQWRFWANLNASGWAVSIAAAAVALVLVILNALERGPLPFDMGPVGSLGFNLIALLAGFLAVFVVVALVGTLVCLLGAIIGQVVYRGPQQ